tara:strand:- start:119 stop:310 length:192 start_codon:yes stop_codon:yes gene_type:complete
MTRFKIYFKRQLEFNVETLTENEIVTNVTFVSAENIQEATLYALKTFGDNFIEIKTDYRSLTK